MIQPLSPQDYLLVRYFIHTTTILTCHYLLSAPENKFENFDTVVRFRSNGDPEVTITIKVMISFIVVLENGFQKKILVWANLSKGEHISCVEYRRENI